MNEKRIREVIEIEKQAEEMLALAKREAEQLPVQAEAEARDILDKARASAREEARSMLEHVEAADDGAEIMSKAKERMGESEELAARNIERAVTYVLERVVGKA